MQAALLAIDVGLRSGLAWYAADGRLLAYRSRHFSNRAALRQAAWLILRDEPNLQWVVLEGGGPLADIWSLAARRRELQLLQLAAHDWRADLLLQREQRSGAKAKDVAGTLARRVIAWSHAPSPTSLRHDAAEAILVGIWAVQHLGWLPSLPPELQRGQ